MEIHPPHAIRSVKDFLLQLLTITVGILIALTLDGLLGWIHDHRLVHEAEANLTTEVRENQAALSKGMQGLRTSEQQLTGMLALVHQLQQNRATPLKNATFSWTLTELHGTSWSTAGATGAIAHMEYAEVKRYTRVYDLQQQFMTIQNGAFDSAMSANGLGTLLQKDMKKVSDSELSQAEHVIGLALARAGAVENVGTALSGEYTSLSLPFPKSGKD